LTERQIRNYETWYRKLRLKLLVVLEYVVKPRTKKRQKSSRALWILSSIIVIVVVLVVVGLSASQPREKEPAQKYFQILWSTFEDPSFPEFPDTSQLMMLGVSFNITAVGGDAHNVIVESLAMSEPQELGNMAKGEVKYVSMQFGNYYVTSYNEQMQGYPVKIRINSAEAAGEITFYIPF